MPDKPVASRANDLATDAIKQLITLDGATLLLTIAFLKDIVEKSPQSCRWCLPFGWAALGISMAVGWLALAHAARKLGECEGNETYLFGRGTELRCYAIAAQALFMIGTLLLLLFSVSNFK